MTDAAEPGLAGGGRPSLGQAVVIAATIVALAIACAAAMPKRWDHPVGLVAALALGAVLSIAGASKVVDLGRWRSESSALGVPWPVAAVVPVVELVDGALLIVGIGWPFVPLVAGGMLVAFTVVVIGQLRRGRRPHCACFGAWSNAPMSGRTVIRNAALVAMTALALLR